MWPANALRIAVGSLMLSLPLCARSGESDESTALEQVVVTSTRSTTLVQDQPLRVEVVPDVEIEESLSVAPGNLTNLLNELAGARMQLSAPGLGGTSLQLRGLPGRHAQILSDGLPLTGGQTDSFSLMQTPPLDLARVEVIKGVASALYGGSALSGVLNLISRQPGDETQLLLNQTSLGGTDLVAFLGGKAPKPWGYTTTASVNYQSREDPDHDGWAELPGFARFTLRPRLYWSDGPERSVLMTLGLAGEDRTGGTMPGHTLPDGQEFAEELHTRRADVGGISRIALADGRVVNARAAASVTEYDRVYGATRVLDTESIFFGEATLQGQIRGHKWIIGGALEYERLHTDDVPGVGYDYTVPGVFAQDEFAPAPWVAFAVSARVDAHSEYGTFVSPRVSALFRSGEKWSLRASLGTGFAAPTPKVEEVDARSLAVLNPLTGLRAERASSASLDAKWVGKPWDVNLSVFSSEIRHPLTVIAAQQPGRIDLLNSDAPLRARGVELLVGLTTGPLHLLANSTYLDVTEAAPGEARHDADLIPRFSAEIAWILEDEDRGRVGLEVSYTGTQAVTDNPYRGESASYYEVNALAEVKWGRAHVFVNALNLTDLRQPDYDPLLLPAPGLGGQPITDAWAPLVGRTFNLGVRLEL